MVCQILHTRDSEDGRFREVRTWHRLSIIEALAFANTLRCFGNRRERIKIVGLDTNMIVRDDGPVSDAIRAEPKDNGDE